VGFCTRCTAAVLLTGCRYRCVLRRPGGLYCVPVASVDVQPCFPGLCLSRQACLVVWSGALLEACGWPVVGMHVSQHRLAAFWDAAWSPLLCQRPCCFIGRTLPSPHASSQCGRHVCTPPADTWVCAADPSTPCQSDLLHFLLLLTGPTSHSAEQALRGAYPPHGLLCPAL
jgi:hypothetical protein